MGWSGGSELMTEVISGIQTLGVMNDAKAEAFYSKLIAAFESHDCDTLEKCLGEDRRFDAAFFKANPYMGGRNAAERGLPFSANPWAKHSPESALWEKGYGEECEFD
jgi:hypothetical protein